MIIACSLAEYCKNRESGFYKSARFFHDIFHGYSHKCSQAQHVSRLKGSNGLNTSIMEQLNSFLQRLKAAGKLMSQAHFVFYTQYFLHEWNKKQYATNQKHLNIGFLGIS